MFLIVAKTGTQSISFATALSAAPPNNLNLRIKTYLTSVGEHATVYVWFLGQIHIPLHRDYFWDTVRLVNIS